MTNDLQPKVAEASAAIRFLDGADRLIGLICKSVVLSTGVALLFAIIIGVIGIPLIYLIPNLFDRFDELDRKKDTHES